MQGMCTCAGACRKCRCDGGWPRQRRCADRVRLTSQVFLSCRQEFSGPLDELEALFFAHREVDAVVAQIARVLRVDELAVKLGGKLAGPRKFLAKCRDDSRVVAVGLVAFKQ